MLQFKTLAMMTTLFALLGIGGEAEGRSGSNFSVGFGAQRQVYAAPAPVYVQPVKRGVIYRKAVSNGCAAPDYWQAVPVTPFYSCVECVPLCEGVYVQRSPVVCQERVTAFPFFSFSWSWFKR